MAFDVEAAKQEGYTDEEIQAYLRSEQGTPLPTQQPIDRSEEYTGLAQGIGGKTITSALEYGIPGAGAYYGLKKIAENLKGPVSPAQAAQMGQAAQAGSAMVPSTQATGTYGQGTRTPNLRVATPTNAGAQAFEQMGQQLTRPQTQAPSVLQRGMEYASRMRDIAAQRVLPVAGVPGAVAGGGAAATGLAGGQMRAMTPQQRKSFYDNEMLGAMGGDAALAAAIMNRGQ